MGLILVQSILATLPLLAILFAALTVMAWVADHQKPTTRACRFGCDNPPTVIVSRPYDGEMFTACSRCAEELTALYGWSRR